MSATTIPFDTTLGTTLGATLGEGAILVGPLQPLLLLPPIIGWAWVVSKVLDKHAGRFYLGREVWNTVHMIAGLLAFVAVIVMPIGGWLSFGVGYAVMVAILALDIGLFVGITNRDEKVPEHARLTMDLSKWSEARAAKASAKKAGSSTLIIKKPDGSTLMVPEKGTTAFEVRVAAEEIALRARETRASQVDLTPTSENAYAVSMLVDGVRQPGEPMSPQDAGAIIDVWKTAAALDVQDRRRKQLGRIKASNDAGMYEVRVSTSGTQAGPRLTLQFEPSESVRRSLDKLGMTDSQLKTVRELINEDGGVVLLAAPNDNGRTTTMYSIIRAHDAYTSNVQTLELEIEDTLEGVRQNVFDAAGDGPDFATQLRSMLRRDPDIVGVADVPDVQTAQEIAKADLERTRVYPSMRADGATAALQIWTKAVGDPKQATKHIKAVIAERLVRKLCENCRVAYAPPPEMLKKLGLPADKIKQLHKKGGQVLVRNKPEVCPVCKGIGYMGQMGVFEVLPFGDAERKLAAQGDWAGLRTELRKKQVPSLAQMALRRAVEGVTSVEEVSRITAPPKKKKK